MLTLDKLGVVRKVIAFAGLSVTASGRNVKTATDCLNQVQTELGASDADFAQSRTALMALSQSITPKSEICINSVAEIDRYRLPLLEQRRQAQRSVDSNASMPRPRAH